MIIDQKWRHLLTRSVLSLKKLKNYLFQEIKSNIEEPIQISEFLPSFFQAMEIKAWNSYLCILIEIDDVDP